MEQKVENKIEKKVENKNPKFKQETEFLVRIMSTDIPGQRNVYAGLTYIKGVSFSLSNAICLILGMDKMKKIGSLSKEEIDKITKEIENPRVPDFFKNRRNDLDTGETKHLSTNDLDLRKEFDIKRLKKIRSYRGLRHARGLPVRGQRTKSHFRTRGKKNKAIGVQKKKEVKEK